MGFFWGWAFVSKSRESFYNTSGCFFVKKKPLSPFSFETVLPHRGCPSFDGGKFGHQPSLEGHKSVPISLQYIFNDI